MRALLVLGFDRASTTNALTNHVLYSTSDMVCNSWSIMVMTLQVSVCRMLRSAHRISRGNKRWLHLPSARLSSNSRTIDRPEDHRWEDRSYTTIWHQNRFHFQQTFVWNLVLDITGLTSKTCVSLTQGINIYSLAYHQGARWSSQQVVISWRAENIIQLTYSKIGQSSVNKL